MATITAQSVLGTSVAETATTKLSTLVWTAASTGADTVRFSGSRVLVLIRNSGLSTRTYAVASSADPYNRKADIGATNLAAGALVGKIFAAPGWEQTTGGRDLSITCNHAEMLIAAIDLP